MDRSTSSASVVSAAVVVVFLLLAYTSTAVARVGGDDRSSSYSRMLSQEDVHKQSNTQQQRSLSSHGNCMSQQFGGSLGCTAQDMKFQEVTSLSVVNHNDDDGNNNRSPLQICNCTSDYTLFEYAFHPCTDSIYDIDCGTNPINTIYGACSGNDTSVQVSFTVDFLVGPTRYDVGMYIATDGGSAMNGNECLITGLDAGSYSDGSVVVEETDGDNCNDIETSIASGTVVMKDYAFESLTLSCTDSNNDGLLDFDVGIAWSVQKGKYDCDIDDPDKAPVASSYPKCWYDQNERITLNIVVPNNPSPTSQPSQSSQPSSQPSESLNPTVYNPDTSNKPSDEPNSPIAIDDFVITEYEKFVNISVLDNDFDPDGDAITINYVLTKQPDHGLGIVMPGSIFYYPEAKFTGVDVFAYRICDTSGLCDEANVSVTVLPPTNNAPVANDDFVSVPCGEAIDVRVLDNDYDDDGDDFTVELIVPPLFGESAVNIADGTIQYTSNGINCGSADIFLYAICDTSGSCDHAMVHVTVAVPTALPTKLPTKEPTQGPTKQPVVANNPPVAVNDYASVERHGSVDVPVLLNDFDVDGDSLTIVAASNPSCGSTNINSASGTIMYTSNGDACGGVDTFQYSICDESSGCSSATVHITVNSPPLIANDDNISVQCGNPIVIPVLINDSYDDNSSITIVAVTDPNNGNVVVNAGQESITYTSDASCVAEDVFSYLACTEGYDKCDEATVTVTIVANEAITTTIFPSSKPSFPPSIAPSSMPSSPPTRGEWYYPNWDPEKEICVNDKNPDWILDVQYENYSYKSKEQCCHEHFWWRITQCMENQHSMYYNDGDSCQQRVYFDNHESKFTPGDWDHTILYFTMEDCCVNTHWWDMPGCMAGSPLQYSFTFQIEIVELKDPEFCQMANLLANTLRKAMENGLDDEDTMVNVTTVGNATLTREFETGNPKCGGSLEGESWIGDTNGREDTSPANGATSAIEIEITSTCQHSKTEEEIDQEMEDMIEKVQFFVESGGYQYEIQQWSRTRDPPVKSLWPTEVDAESFEVLSNHNPFRVIRNNPYYPDWTTHQTCVNDNLQAAYMNEDLNREYYIFDTLEDCCNTWFSYDEGCSEAKIDTST